MEATEIQERNEQIALMLGMKMQETYVTNWKKFDYLLNSIEDTLKFHSDWNWLMEAIEFIESLRMDVPGYFVVDYYVVNAGRNYCNISSGLKHADGETVSPHFYEKSAHGEDRITSVFIAVSDFAKLYNNK